MGARPWCSSDCCPWCCFPGQQNSIISMDGKVKFVEDVEIGDMAKVYLDDGTFTYSRIWALGHKNKDRKAKFIQLDTKFNRIMLSPRHCIFIKDEDGIIQCVFAKDVKVGCHSLLCCDDDNDVTFEPVISIDIVDGQGLYAPFPEQGSIILNGVIASPYSEVEHSLAEKALAPFRLLSKGLPSGWMDKIMTPNSDGVPSVFDASLKAYKSIFETKISE